MEGVIHSSVPEMIKAGILDEKSIPKKGGDNPQISIANVTGEWGLMRKAAERKQSNASEDTLVNGGESGAAVVDKVEEAAAGASKKALGGVSSLLAKVRG